MKLINWIINLPFTMLVYVVLYLNFDSTMVNDISWLPYSNTRTSETVLVCVSLPCALPSFWSRCIRIIITRVNTHYWKENFPIPDHIIRRMLLNFVSLYHWKFSLLNFSLLFECSIQTKSFCWQSIVYHLILFLKVFDFESSRTRFFCPRIKVKTCSSVQRAEKSREFHDVSAA